MFSQLGYGLDRGTGLEPLYLATAVAISSTVIVVKILSERMELSTVQSQLALGILVIQDLFAVALLSVQSDLGLLSKVGPLPLVFSVIKAIVLLVLAGSAARWLLPAYFKRVSRNAELMLVSSLSWLFLVVGVAHFLGVSLEMGALIAGVVIASFPYHVEIASKLSSLRDFFIMLFFVSLGLRIKAPNPRVLELVLWLIALIYATRAMTFFPVMRFFRLGNRSALLTSLNLSQLSEFTLVLGALGLRFGHISPDVLSAFVLTFAMTALLSSVIMPNSHLIYQAVQPMLVGIGLKDRLLPDQEDRRSKQPTTPQDEPDVIVLGLFREGSSLLSEMLERDAEWVKKKWLVVDLNPQSHHRLHEMGIRCVYGDIGHLDTLRTLPLERAKWILCTIADRSLRGSSNLRILHVVKSYAPQAKVFVTAESMTAAVELYAQGADYVMMPRIPGARITAEIWERVRVGEGEAVKQNEIARLQSRNEVVD